MMAAVTHGGPIGVEPYLYYVDGAAALEWLTGVVGFRELVRYLDENGAVAEAAPPADQPYAARTYTVCDPQGYTWTFWQPLPGRARLQPGWREVQA